MSGQTIYAYVNNDPLNGTDPLGLYTLQLGVSGGGTLTVYGYKIADFQASGGLAFDDSGGFRFYGSAAAGKGFGDSVKLGGQVAVSNAATVDQLSGPSVNQSFTYGEGLGGSIDYSHIAPGVGSIGFTAGLAAGAGYTATVGPTGLCSLGCVKDAVSNLLNGGSSAPAPTPQPASTPDPSSNVTGPGGSQPTSLK